MNGSVQCLGLYDAYRRFHHLFLAAGGVHGCAWPCKLAVVVGDRLAYWSVASLNRGRCTAAATNQFISGLRRRWTCDVCNNVAMRSRSAPSSSDRRTDEALICCICHCYHHRWFAYLQPTSCPVSVVCDAIKSHNNCIIFIFIHRKR